VVQLLRPRMGFGSDVGGRRTPWIVGGMGVLATGGIGAALSTAWMGSSPLAGIVLAFVCFGLIGIGVSASGTSLLVLLAKRVQPERRAAAATVVWLMMIAGFAVTAGVAGQLLDPYTPARLVGVMVTVSVAAVVVTLLALRGVEGHAHAAPVAPEAKPKFRVALAEVWAEPAARRFTIFVFVSMLAYSAQDLILEPFAGIVFGYTPGESTSLSGVQHGGVLPACCWRRPRAAASPGAASARCAPGRWAAASGLGDRALAGPGGGGVGGAGVATACQRLPARCGQRRLFDRRHRLDDAHGQRGPRAARRRAHGPVGRRAGGGLRPRRPGRRRSERPRARLMGSPAAAYATVFALEALLFVAAALLALRIEQPRAAAEPAAFPQRTPLPAQAGTPVVAAAEMR
jgi:MFS transporter, BCD family, chlorophyll transporter